MSNFEYWGNFGNQGTSGNDTFRITRGVSSHYHNGSINGYGGYDNLIISGSKDDWELSKNGAIYFLKTEVDGIWSRDTVTIQLEDIEKVQFVDGSFDLKSEKEKPKSDTAEKKWNDIIGSKRGDNLTGTRKDDYLWGDKGDDDLSGGSGDDLIVGGKGFDLITGGRGSDTFGVSKKLGKGKKNLDFITDFEVGIDAIYVDGDTKGLWIDSFEGDAVLVRGKKDVIAYIEGAGDQLNWSGDSNFIM